MEVYLHMAKEQKLRSVRKSGPCPHSLGIAGHDLISFEDEAKEVRTRGKGGFFSVDALGCHATLGARAVPPSCLRGIDELGLVSAKLTRDFVF